MSTLKQRVKSSLPNFILIFIGALISYMQRLARWFIILVQIRGASVADELKLILSACAAPATSLKKLLKWQDPVLLFDTEVIVRNIGRFHLRHHCDDLWHVLPWHERAVLEAHRMHLHTGDTYVDAGANIGFFTLLASRLVGESGKVIALEMMPDTATNLRHNLTLNNAKNVTVIEGALYDKPGQTIVAKVNEGHYGQASIISNIIHGKVKEVVVKTTTLAQELDGYARVALLKMDLEGAEVMALKGAGVALSRIDVILFEQWTNNEKEDSTTMYLQNAGFKVRSIDGRNEIAVNKARN